MILFLQNVKNGGIILNSKTNAISAFEVLFCESVIDFIDNMEISLKAKTYSLFDILEQ